MVLAPLLAIPVGGYKTVVAAYLPAIRFRPALPGFIDVHKPAAAGDVTFRSAYVFLDRLGQGAPGLAGAFIAAGGVFHTNLNSTRIGRLRGNQTQAFRAGHQRQRSPRLWRTQCNNSVSAVIYLSPLAFLPWRLPMHLTGPNPCRALPFDLNAI